MLRLEWKGLGVVDGEGKVYVGTTDESGSTALQLPAAAPHHGPAAACMPWPHWVLSPPTHHRLPLRIRLTASHFLGLGESSSSGFGLGVLSGIFCHAASRHGRPRPMVSCGLVLAGPHQIRAHLRTTSTNSPSR